MSPDDYSGLIERVCALRGLDPPTSPHEGVHLHVGGMAFTLLPTVGRDLKNGIAFVCRFGALPPQVRAQALQRLLETNLFMFGADMPRFACDPQTAEVLLVSYAPLAQTTAESLIQMLEQVAGFARHWNESFFLDESGDVGRSSVPSPAAPVQVTPAMARGFGSR